MPIHLQKMRTGCISEQLVWTFVFCFKYNQVLSMQLFMISQLLTAVIAAVLGKATIFHHRVEWV